MLLHWSTAGPTHPMRDSVFVSGEATICDCQRRDHCTVGPGHAFQEFFKLLVWSKKKERNINVILTWRAGGRFPVQSAPWLFANCAITFSLAAILQSSSFPTLLRLVPPLRKFSEIAYPSVEKCSLYRVCADYDTPKPTEICRKA